MHSPTIEKLIQLFSKFPTVGPRTAGRFVAYLAKASKQEIGELLENIKRLADKIKTCSLCGVNFESDDGDLCDICTDQRREKTILCIVEKQIDLESIEKTKSFKGFYFILKSDSDLQKLVNKIKQNNLKEIILAINPTSEGIKTILFLKRKLEPYKMKISQLGLGIPVGGELEYADQETLSSALKNRK